MKSGKASEAVLKRSVIKKVNEQEQVVSKAGIGSDAGLFPCEEATGVMAVACTSLAGSEEALVSLAVHRTLNSMAAAGGSPLAVTLQLVLPEEAEEKVLKTMLKEGVDVCKSTGVALANGHTQISSLVKEPVVSATAVGNAPLAMTLEETVYGSHLVMTKSAGLAGAALLAKHYRENLHERYTYGFIDKAAAKESDFSVLPEIELLKNLGVRHMHDVAEGGVFGAVWELCERLNAGVELELKKIPICQETVEICEYFDVNPYQLKGDGALLFLTLDSETVLRALAAEGISAAVIGRITDGNDRILINGEETRFLEPNRVDDYETARKFERK